MVVEGERSRRRRRTKQLEVEIPSFFRCPISLDVMKSPVSLCTGITYDRCSIQRWLEMGNTTCPATALPLPSTDLVPNLTLRRLIDVWMTSPSATDHDASPRFHGCDFISELSVGRKPVSTLRSIVVFLSNEDVDELEKNAVARSPVLTSLLVSFIHKGSDLEVAEAAVRVSAAIIGSSCVEEASKMVLVEKLVADAASTFAGLVRVLDAGELDPRIDAARVIESVISDFDINPSLGLVELLVRLISSRESAHQRKAKTQKADLDPRAVAAGLQCLLRVATRDKLARSEMVRVGAIRAAVTVLASDNPAITAPVAGKALKVMELAAGSAEGRALICQDAGSAMPALVTRMMKSGKEGAEAAVAVLWTVCVQYKDRKAISAVAATEKGRVAMKLLLIMQSGCAPAARKMATELLRLFSGQRSVGEYDSKTTHIMPF